MRAKIYRWIIPTETWLQADKKKFYPIFGQELLKSTNLTIYKLHEIPNKNSEVEVFL